MPLYDILISLAPGYMIVAYLIYSLNKQRRKYVELCIRCERQLEILSELQNQTINTVITMDVTDKKQD